MYSLSTAQFSIRIGWDAYVCATKTSVLDYVHLLSSAASHFPVQPFRGRPRSSEESAALADEARVKYFLAIPAEPEKMSSLVFIAKTYAIISARGLAAGNFPKAKVGADIISFVQETTRDVWMHEPWCLVQPVDVPRHVGMTKAQSLYDCRRTNVVRLYAHPLRSKLRTCHSSPACSKPRKQRFLQDQDSPSDCEASLIVSAHTKRRYSPQEVDYNIENVVKRHAACPMATSGRQDSRITAQ